MTGIKTLTVHVKRSNSERSNDYMDGPRYGTHVPACTKQGVKEKESDETPKRTEYPPLRGRNKKIYIIFFYNKLSCKYSSRHIKTSKWVTNEG